MAFPRRTWVLVLILATLALWFSHSQRNSSNEDTIELTRSESGFDHVLFEEGTLPAAAKQRSEARGFKPTRVHVLRDRYVSIALSIALVQQLRPLADRIIFRHPPCIEYPMLLTAGTGDKQEDAEAADRSLSVSPFRKGMLCDGPTSAHNTVAHTAAECMWKAGLEGGTPFALNFSQMLSTHLPAC
jgi:hypothetical protein